MEDKSGLMNERDFILKSRLEVKLNDLEKKHLETKEREAQTVGFLERKLRQVELEHKTELKLRRQLRYEVNNLRKKLLETYQLYTNTLEQNEQMRSELDRLKCGSMGIKDAGTNFNISRQVNIQIQETSHDEHCVKSGNSEFFQKGRLNWREFDDEDSKEKRFSRSFDIRNGRHSVNCGVNLYYGRSQLSGINKTVERIKIPGGGMTLGKTISGVESSRDLSLKSERAKDWLNQIEELYKPLEYPNISSRMNRNGPNSFHELGIENSLNLGINPFSDEEYLSGEYSLPENAEDVITNTGFIIDQINQQDKELSSLLNKTFISYGNRNSLKGKWRSTRNNRK
ncbi:hypothetical protein OJ253_363 [Cryptosporidium canis]|uniref:Uncharacterized protein n=1 Tax=Cryptosporidium canis TaxID=195482 RepID=A0A9D5HYT4_9CRYT|nr:hypothetical protein OJ253_363 [Cryptosporidium canis]